MKIFIKSLLTIVLMSVLGILVYVLSVADLTPLEWWFQTTGIVAYIVLMNVGLKHTWLKWN